MNTSRKLILAGLMTTQLLAVSAAYAQDPVAAPIRLETIVVTAKKVAVAPITRLETIVVVAHRGQPAPLEGLIQTSAKAPTIAVNRS
jgi:hypothetical protein